MLRLVDSRYKNKKMSVWLPRKSGERKEKKIWCLVLQPEVLRKTQLIKRNPSLGISFFFVFFVLFSMT
jgi:hypothetical protein